MEKQFIAVKEGETVYEAKRFLPFQNRKEEIVSEIVETPYSGRILYIRNSYNAIYIHDKELRTNNVMSSRTIIATTIDILKEIFFKDIAKHNKARRERKIQGIIHF